MTRKYLISCGFASPLFDEFAFGAIYLLPVLTFIGPTVTI